MSFFSERVKKVWYTFRPSNSHAFSVSLTYLWSFQRLPAFTSIHSLLKYERHEIITFSIKTKCLIYLSFQLGTCLRSRGHSYKKNLFPNKMRKCTGKHGKWKRNKVQTRRFAYTSLFIFAKNHVINNLVFN